MGLSDRPRTNVGCHSWSWGALRGGGGGGAAGGGGGGGRAGEGPLTGVPNVACRF